MSAMSSIARTTKGHGGAADAVAIDSKSYQRSNWATLGCFGAAAVAATALGCTESISSPVAGTYDVLRP